jgi:hypothetical protein
VSWIDATKPIESKSTNVHTSFIAIILMANAVAAANAAPAMAVWERYTALGHELVEQVRSPRYDMELQIQQVHAETLQVQQDGTESCDHCCTMYLYKQATMFLNSDNATGEWRQWQNSRMKSRKTMQIII